MFKNSLQTHSHKIEPIENQERKFYNDFTIHACSLNYNWSNFRNFRKPKQNYDKLKYLVSDWPVFILDRLLIGRFQWKRKRIEFHHLLTKISETNSALILKDRERWEIFFFLETRVSERSWESSFSSWWIDEIDDFLERKKHTDLIPVRSYLLRKIYLQRTFVLGCSQSKKSMGKFKICQSSIDLNKTEF